MVVWKDVFCSQDYPCDITIDVRKITSAVLGKEITKRCGNEGKHRNLNKSNQTTLRFLQAAISFIPDAIKTGADLTNAAFIFSQPGKEFIVKAGGGDWEFFFSEDDSDEIRGRCVRKGKKPLLHGVWNGLKFYVCRDCSGSISPQLAAATGTTVRLALTQGWLKYLCSLKQLTAHSGVTFLEEFCYTKIYIEYKLC